MKARKNTINPTTWHHLLFSLKKHLRITQNVTRWLFKFRIWLCFYNVFQTYFNVKSWELWKVGLKDWFVHVSNHLLSSVFVDHKKICCHFDFLSSEKKTIATRCKASSNGLSNNRPLGWSDKKTGRFIYKQIWSR